MIDELIESYGLAKTNLEGGWRSSMQNQRGPVLDLFEEFGHLAWRYGQWATEA